MNIQELYNKTQENSLKNSKIIKKTTKKQITKQMIIAIITISSALSMCACQSNDMYLNYNTTLERDEAYQTLTEYGIQVYNENDDYVSHSVEDYKKIEGLNEVDLLGYYSLLGMNESEKVVQALGYENWNDFLIKNNYVNENGKPDIYKWKRAMQENNEKESEGYHK